MFIKFIFLEKTGVGCDVCVDVHVNVWKCSLGITTI